MIQIRKIDFENIDKNRWNGLVHYSPSPSVYSYHWYLKAITGPFDILIEDNYESGIPVFQESLTDFQKKLLPETGIHSINMLSAGRVKSFAEVINSDYTHSWVALKSGQSDVWHSIMAGLEKHTAYILTMHQNYEECMKIYKQEFSALIQNNKDSNIKIIANSKPEDLLSTTPLSEMEKNMLYRVMYNAMHRGILFTLQVSDNNCKATSVFIYGSGIVFEIWSHTSGDASLMAILYDYLFRTHAGRNMKLRFSPFSSLTLIRLLDTQLSVSVSFGS